MKKKPLDLAKLSKTPEMLATFQLLAMTKLKQWDLERDIERMARRTFDGMDRAISDYCAACAEPVVAKPEDLRFYLESLVVEQ